VKQKLLTKLPTRTRLCMLMESWATTESQVQSKL